MEAPRTKEQGSDRSSYGDKKPTPARETTRETTETETTTEPLAPTSDE